MLKKTEHVQNRHSVFMYKGFNMSSIQLISGEKGGVGKSVVARLLDRFGSSVQYVVVKNKGRGKRFSIFESSRAKEKALALNAHILELDELYPNTMNKIDELNCSFWAATNNTDPQAGPCLSFLERRRVKIWLENSYRKLNETGCFTCSSALGDVVKFTG